MANGIRFRGKFESLKGTAYEVLLIQDGYVGIEHEMSVQNGFEINYSGADRFAAMKSSKGSVAFMIESVGHESVVYDFINSGDEGLWTLTLSDGDGLLWCGQPLLEGVEIEDVDYPYAFRVAAGCGLKLLKDQKYAPSIAMDSFISLRSVVSEILRLTPVGRSVITTLFGEPELSYNCGWTCGPHNFWDTRVKFWSLVDVNDLGFIEYRDCYKVLESLLVAVGSRIWLGSYAEVMNGWFIGQIDQLDAQVTEWDVFLLDGTPVNMGELINTDVELTQTSGNARMGGGSWSFDPVLRSASNSYEHKTFINYLAGVNASNNTPTYVPPQLLETIPGVTVMTLKGAITLQFTNLTLANYVPMVFVFRFFLNVGNDTLKRSVTVTGSDISYGTAAWGGTGNYYHIAQSYFMQAGTGDNFILAIPISIMTPPIPGDGGDFDFGLELVHVKKLDGSLVTGAEATITWSFGNATALMLYGGANTVVVDSSKYVVTNNDAPQSSDKIEVTTYWGDGPTPNSRGALFIYDAPYLSLSDFWERAGSSGTNNLTRTLCESYLDHRRVPRRRYRGEVWSRSSFVFAFILAGVRYIPGEVTYHADTETWSGEWIEVAKLAGNNGYSGPILTGPGGTTIDNDVLDGDGLVSAGNGSNVLLNVNSISTIDDSIEAGAVTTITVTDALAGETIVAGQELTIYNTLTNTVTNVTVINDVADGDTTITVTGTADEAIAAGSLVFVNNSNNYTISGSLAPTLVEKNVTDSATGVSLMTRQFGKLKPTLAVSNNVITIVSPVGIRVVSMVIGFPSSYSDELLRDGPVIDYTQVGYVGSLGMLAEVYVYNGSTWPLLDTVKSMEVVAAGHCTMRMTTFGGVQAAGTIFIHLI